MQDYLDRLGKQVVTVVDDDIDDKFFFLPGVSRFKKPSAVHTDDSWLTVILDATSADRRGVTESDSWCRTEYRPSYLQCPFCPAKYVRP